MKKVRLATVWLDGCSGCHMSLLDIDEAIWRRQAGGRGVRPAGGRAGVSQGRGRDLIEGAVSSQDDLEKVQTIRQRSKLVVALGDCAVTGNVPAMRNSHSARKLLERIYIEGAQENPGSHRGRSRAAAPGRAGARGGEGGSARARLSAVGRGHRLRAGRTAGRPRADLSSEGEIWLRARTRR
jgi:coenzyme F420-reducing hydrogenase gamma subunit